MNKATDNYELPKPRAHIKGEPRTYKEKLLKKFEKAINDCREANGYKPLSFVGVKTLLKGRNEVQLATLLADCTHPTIPFTALFFTKLKGGRDKIET